MIAKADRQSRRRPAANPDRTRADARSPGTTLPDPLGLLGLQSTAGNRAVVQYLQAEGAVSTPDDPDELAADRNAEAVVGAGPVEVGPAAPMAIGPAQPLPQPVRAFMEPRFGSDFADVRVHTDRAAHDANAALQAEAFTHGDDIYFGAGRTPGTDPLTAHELAHVVQQRQTGAGVAAKRIQPSFTASYPVRLGVFEVDMQTRQGALNTPPTLSGFDGYIRFVPGPGAPNSNLRHARGGRLGRPLARARLLRPRCRARRSRCIEHGWADWIRRTIGRH